MGSSLLLIADVSPGFSSQNSLQHELLRPKAYKYLARCSIAFDDGKQLLFDQRIPSRARSSLP